MLPLPPVTRTLVLTCVGVFILQGLIPLLGPLLALWPFGSGLFLPWQPLTYAFLHGSIAHLFFNMFGLSMFGAELERLWGPRRYLRFLLAGVLAAALTQLVVTWGGTRPTVGASGALYALLLAYGWMFPRRILMPLFPPIPMEARHFVIVFGTLELMLGLMGQSGIAHFAHLGGMAGGWLMLRHWRGGRSRG
jgi:membrane associated rhomboid family serine protease